MKKLFFTVTLLLAASTIFSSCSCDNGDNGNGNNNNNPGIGRATATTDPGVLIGYNINNEPIRWATRNVAAPGTFTQNPTDRGMLFQWNRHTGWSASTDPVVSSPAGATWNNSHATGEVWTRTNDPCPTGWRIPTPTEFEALLNAGYEWITRIGVNGTVFGSGNNTLFLPAAGWRNRNGVFGMEGANGIYWTSSPSTRATDAMHFWIREDNSLVHHTYRANAVSVRCVAE